jgi:hypothetical protein
MFLLLTGGKSFASKERKERRVFILLLVSRLRLMVANFVTTRVYAIKSSFVLLSRKIVLPLSTKFRRHSGGMRKDFIEKGVI